MPETEESRPLKESVLPPWFPVAGVILGTLTLIFLMGLVGLSTTGKEVPCQSRFLVVAILGFGAALASSFLGGSAAASGAIPIPFAKDHPIQISVYGGIAVLIIIMILGSNLYSSTDRCVERPTRDGAVYDPALNDPKIWDLQEQVNDLRGSWETVPQYGEGKRLEVLERATNLATTLLNVDDDSLGPSGRIIKREYACYALIMQASTEDEGDVKRREVSADRAILQCESALSEMTSIRSAANQSANFKYTAAWIREENEEAFTNYLLAMATCLKATAAGDHAKALDVSRILESVPSFYLNKYPPDRDYVLKACVASEKEMADASF